MSTMQKIIFAYRWIRYGSTSALRMEYKEAMLEAQEIQDRLIPEIEKHIDKLNRFCRMMRKNASKRYLEFLRTNNQEGLASVRAEIDQINAEHKALVNPLIDEMADLRAAYLMAREMYRNHCDRIQEINELHQIHFLYCSREKNTLPTSVDYGLRLRDMVF